jgi:hypothetical protein
MNLVAWDRAISLYPRATFILGFTLVLSQAIPSEQRLLLKTRIESYIHKGLQDFSSLYTVSLENCRFSHTERKMEDNDCWVVHLPRLQGADIQTANQYTNDWAANSWQIRVYPDLNVKLVTGCHTVILGRHFFKSWASSTIDYNSSHEKYITRLTKFCRTY